MSHIKNKMTIVVVVLIIAVGYHLFSPLLITTEANDDIPEVNYALNSIGTSIKPVVASLSGDLTSFEKSASGNVAVYDNNGQKILRFEDFEIVNGPGLSIYLATDITSEDSIDLGEVKATKGNVNYELPVNIDLEKYDTVLIWCETYNRLYGYAELK
ncbi:MAG: DM13 domain-containing protein [Candidatus Pacearchaeota archaeon]